MVNMLFTVCKNTKKYPKLHPLPIFIVIFAVYIT
ncbi:hypothetical protein SAMN06298210_11368 [Prevotellaceae bacterium KH2P17]|nr:hypothetical protein SAMN06298210_11368 [Prevotellaceae bacterium KH2P17]